MIKYIFGSGELVEWFESEGTPGTFEIRTTAQATEEALDKFSEVIKKVPVEFLKKAYYGLHDLELEFAVKKVGEVYWI